MTDEDEVQRVVLYRIVYGAVRGRVERYYAPDDPASIRRDPLRGLHLDPSTVTGPEDRAAIAEAVEDAIAGRRPKW
jgi:hypothetical protein